MDPSSGPSGSAVIAQVSVAGDFTAVVNAQGMSTSGDDWQAEGIMFSSSGGGGGDGVPSEDYCEPSAWDYRGAIAETITGRTCQAWAAQSPHSHSRTPNNYPEFGLEGEHNYCRNPDGEPTAWCYTTDPGSRWELCDVGEPAGAEICGVSTDPCSMGGITTDEPGDIDYDDGHSNGMDCRWGLICPSGEAPTVSFNTFQTEANFDYVNIYDGDTVDAVRLARLHGTEIPEDVTASQQFMVVQFTSDGSVTRDGFHGTWGCGEAAAPPPPDPCEGTLEYSDGEGLLDFDSGHGNNEDCRWQLTCTDGAPIVTFTTFNTEANFDYVNVYDGTTTDDVRIGRFHGTSLPDPVTSSGSALLVQFDSDGSVTRDGFHASWECGDAAPPPPPDPCAETLAVGDGGHLDFDASYGNGEDCRWLVSCDSGVPTVSFNSFQTEAGWDYVNIYEGDSTDAERIARLHGGATPPDVTTEGSVLLVQFTSDGSVTRDGFHATATCGEYVEPEPDPCFGGATLTDGGDIDMDEGHSNGQDCRWTLQCNEGAPTVSFNSFQTEANFDYVNIYDGDTTDDPRVARLHGGDTPDDVTASGGVMLVQFTSDGSVTQDGFHATYTCGDAAPPPPPDPCVDDGIALANEGDLDYDSGHGNNHDCRWYLTCDSGVPTVTFNSFNTEGNFDYVNVYDGTTIEDERIGRFHGNGLSNVGDPPLIAGSGSALVVQFTSDGSVTRDGFHATLTCGDAPPPPPPNPCIDGVTLTDGAEIDFPAGSGSYGNGQDCSWTLSCSSGSPTLSFTEFNTEGNFDYVYVYDGASTGDDQLTDRLHGNLNGALPDDLTGSGDTVLLRLTTDGSVTRAGFVSSFACGGDDGGDDDGGDDSGGSCVGDVCGAVDVVSTDSSDGTTYQLLLELSGTASNAYTIYGTVASPLSIPPSIQAPAPFGANTGGVNPAFLPLSPNAPYDGWLTVGISEGDTGGALGTVGLDWDSWTADSPLETTDGAVFWMNPDDAPTGTSIVAQFTTAPGWTATFGAQGRSTSGADWNADGLTFSG
jgi:hypothetical protein